MNELTFTIYDMKMGTKISCTAHTKDVEEACKCTLSIHKENGITSWVISEWFTAEKLKHQGIGKKTMNELLKYCKYISGIPDMIEYIWNGENEYVMEWLSSNFNAVCECPIAVQKTQPDDDWTSHQYVLNKIKVLNYFGITA